MIWLGLEHEPDYRGPLGGTSRKGNLRTLTFSEPSIRKGFGYALTVGYLPPAVQTGVDLNGSPRRMKAFPALPTGVSSGPGVPNRT